MPIYDTDISLIAAMMDSFGYFSGQQEADKERCAYLEGGGSQVGLLGIKKRRVTPPFLHVESVEIKTGSLCCLCLTLSGRHHQRSTLCDRHPCQSQPCFGA